MGKACSLDIRERIVRSVAKGPSRRAAGRRWEVSASCAVKLVARHAATGSAAPARQGRPPGSGILGAHKDFLIARVKHKPDITMPELARVLEAERGIGVHPSSLSRLLCAAGLSYKKALLASEQERRDVRAERRSWIGERQPRMRRQPVRFVFIDETSVKTNMMRWRGRAPRGERLRAQAPFGKWQT